MFARQSERYEPYQFHLPVPLHSPQNPKTNSHNTPIQKIDGKIGLDYASPQEVLRVVRRLSLNKIGGTIKIQDGGKIVECECPGGNSFVLYGGGGAHLHPHPRHPIVVDDPLNAFAYENSNPNQNSSEEDSEDSEDSDFVFCLGVRYVEFNVKFGLAERIAKFYDEVFGCEAGVVVDEKTTKSENKVKVAVVNVDSGQSMLFRELKAGVEPLEYDGHHVSVFVGNSFEDFNAVYNTAEARGLVWINERFSDKADTLEKASEANQFRMRDFKDEEGAFFRLEHEVRCVDHEMFPASRILEEEEVGEL